MTEPRTIVEVFLRENNGLQPAQLGEERPVVPTVEALTALDSHLAGAREARNRVELVLVVLLVAAFASVIALAAVGIVARPVGTVASGSVVAAMLAILRQLHRLWREKMELEMLRALATNLPPNDVVKALQAYFYGKKKR